MKKDINDMDVIEFARKICILKTDTPISIAYDNQYGQKNNRWWSCQREHLSIWCFNYPFGDVPGFEHTPSNSTRKMYNAFQRPETLLWLAEALDESETILNEVVDEIKDISNNSTACARLRKKIPFERIMELLNAK